MSTLIKPVTLRELMEILRSVPAGGRHLVAGGTDWVIKYGSALPDDATVIDMFSLNELRGIREENGFLYIGAMETMTSLHTSPAVRKYASAIADAASVMGSVQIRNRATLGGNLANASPAADTPSAMASLDTGVVIASPSGERTLSVCEVIAAPNKNNLNADEFIKGFKIPVRDDRLSSFAKIGSRSEVSIARLNMAMSARFENGVLRDACVYVGTLGSAAKRCRAAEEALTVLPENRAGMLKEALASFAEEMIPGRSTLPYKRSAIQALGEDVLQKLLDRAKGLEA